jgi:hypothetical protein
VWHSERCLAEYDIEITVVKGHEQQMRSPKHSCSKAALLAVWAVAQLLSYTEHVSVANTSCVPKLLPVGVLFSYSVLPCQDKHCYMLQEKEQTISIVK